MDSDIQDLAKCGSCGGKCCRIFRPISRGGQFYEGDGFEEHCQAWGELLVESGALVMDGDRAVAGPASGVTPYHAPLLSHRSGVVGDEYRAALPVWVDIDRCQFAHPLAGCQLKREFMPAVCKGFMCATPPEE